MNMNADKIIASTEELQVGDKLWKYRDQFIGKRTDCYVFKILDERTLKVCDNPNGIGFCTDTNITRLVQA